MRCSPAHGSTPPDHGTRMSTIAGAQRAHSMDHSGVGVECVYLFHDRLVPWQLIGTVSAHTLAEHPNKHMFWNQEIACAPSRRENERETGEQHGEYPQRIIAQKGRLRSTTNNMNKQFFEHSDGAGYNFIFIFLYRHCRCSSDSDR